MEIAGQRPGADQPDLGSEHGPPLEMGTDPGRGGAVPKQPPSPGLDKAFVASVGQSRRFLSFRSRSFFSLASSFLMRARTFFCCFWRYRSWGRLKVRPECWTFSIH